MLGESAVIAALDIGSEVVRVLVAEYDKSGRLVVSGWGEAPSAGMRRGVVVNIEAAREAVQTAIEAAEHESGRTVEALMASLGGTAVDSLNSRGVVAVSGKNREIGQADVSRVLEAARAVVIPMDRDILHVLPQQYIIDDQSGVRNPLDMIGVRLEAEVHIVTASVSASSNMTKAVERADYSVKNVALGTLAAARAVLSEDEKEMGVLLLDVGAVSTDFILIHGGAPRVTGSVPLGGDSATSDLSIVLKTPKEAAERIKRESGNCWEAFDACEPVVIPGVGGCSPLPVSASELARILKPRMAELFAMVKHRIERIPGAGRLVGCVVLTGGGSLLPGTVELAADVFGQPARLGRLKQSVEWPASGKTGAWATAAGLILLGDAVREADGENDGHRDSDEAGPLKNFIRWFGEFF